MLKASFNPHIQSEKRSKLFWTLSDSWVLAKRSIKHITRNLDQLFSVALFPMMFFLLFRYVFGGAIDTGDMRSRFPTAGSPKPSESYPTKLPEEYQNCMTGINQVLKICWENINKSRNVNNDNGQTVTMTDNKTVLQALALINDCNKYKMDLTTNVVIITDAIKFVQTNEEKLSMSTKEENEKESKEPDYDEDKDQLEEKQEEETGEFNQETTTAFSEFPIELSEYI